ncbi:MAG: Gfo/Idh/MocA family oxidoreductase [Planctomycetota bacterium]|nr:Gfo/Idh/MocA family oxidoreductase [Planctomycetota bacterium]
MSDSSNLRIGFIGAGAIARSRHLPNLAKIPGVKVVAVANRTRASGEAIAKEFAIPEVMEDWRALVRRADVDAVFIGTWPNMHREMSVAALEAGKHVFCQARMAMNLAEGKAMLAAGDARPDLVKMICPPPTRMPFEPFIQQTLASGRLGTITSVELLSVGAANRNPDAVHWRERVEISGRQVMAMGIYAETLHAWVGPYESLSAQTGIFIPRKTDASGAKVEIKVPQAVTITGRLASGALALEHHLGLAADTTTPGDRLTIWGLKGTLRYTFGNTIELAEAGQPLKPVDVPASQQKPWWAEDDFIAAVRAARQGKPWKVTPDFAEGLLYMRKVEAVHLAAETGRAVRPGEL